MMYKDSISMDDIHQKAWELVTNGYPASSAEYLFISFDLFSTLLKSDLSMRAMYGTNDYKSFGMQSMVVNTILGYHKIIILDDICKFWHLGSKSSFDRELQKIVDRDFEQVFLNE